MLDQSAVTRFKNDQTKAKQQTVISGPSGNLAANSLKQRLPKQSQPQALDMPTAGPPSLLSHPVENLQQTPVPTQVPSAPQLSQQPLDFGQMERDVAVEKMLSSPMLQEAVARTKLANYFKRRRGTGGIPTPEGNAVSVMETLLRRM